MCVICKLIRHDTSVQWLFLGCRSQKYELFYLFEKESRIMPQWSNKSQFYSGNSPLPHLTLLQRKDLHHHQMLNTHDHKHVQSGKGIGTHTLAHTLSHRTRIKGVDMNVFASRGGFVMSPSLTSCRRKHGVMSPLAWPPCLKTFHALPRRMRGRHYSE